MGKFNETLAKLKKVLSKPVGGQADQAAQLVTTVSANYEINLVPAVKSQMIKALKLRNLVLFCCIVVAAISAGAVLLLFGIKSGQDIAMSNQDKKLELMSAKLLGYDELGDLVTIQDQLSRLSSIAENKIVMSRVFGAISVMVPSGEDVVQLSELRIDMDTDTIRMDAQTDARVEPLIDYRVLESFKKGVSLTKYDYGRFVDVNDTEIPTWCIKEADDNGNAFKTGESYYAWWDLTETGCGAVKQNTPLPEDSTIKLYYSDEAEVEAVETEIAVADLGANGVQVEDNLEDETVVSIEDLKKAGIEERTRADGSKYYVKVDVKRVKVWRTPQFTKWYNGGKMTLDGAISGVEHFASACTEYTGTLQGKNARWTSTNDCMLVPVDQTLNVIASSNGRDEADNLVLKFTAEVMFEPEFFSFANKHMMAIGPTGQNVTDSYVQIGGMFAQEASECSPDDPECLTNAANQGGTE